MDQPVIAVGQFQNAGNGIAAPAVEAPVQVKVHPMPLSVSFGRAAAADVGGIRIFHISAADVPVHQAGHIDLLTQVGVVFVGGHVVGLCIGFDSLEIIGGAVLGVTVAGVENIHGFRRYIHVAGYIVTGESLPQVVDAPVLSSQVHHHRLHGLGVQGGGSVGNGGGQLVPEHGIAPVLTAALEKQRVEFIDIPILEQAVAQLAGTVFGTEAELVIFLFALAIWPGNQLIEVLGKLFSSLLIVITSFYI